MTQTMPDRTMPTYKRWPVTFVEGSGSTLVDDRGGRYLDLVAGIAVASVGHAHPAVAAAVGDQVRRVVHVSNLYGNEPQQRLSRRLYDMTGKLSFFCNSGAEAIECAIKLARRWGGPGRHRIVAARGGFHGRTLGALAATGQTSKQEPFAPMVPGFVHVPYGDGDALESAVDDDVAAVLLEPVQGEAGVVIPPPGYLALARRLCTERGALFMLDEVQTGVGRTGRWFAHEHEQGAVPDVVCLAKAVAGGLPMGVCLASEDVARSFRLGDHASTFGGGPVQCAAALATLDVIESERLVERAAHIGRWMELSLRESLPRAEVRGRGLLIGVAFDDEVAAAVAAGAFQRGVLVNDVTTRVVRLSPPLVIAEEEARTAVDVLREVWGEIGAA